MNNFIESLLLAVVIGGGVYTTALIIGYGFSRGVELAGGLLCQWKRIELVVKHEEGKK